MTKNNLLFDEHHFQDFIDYEFIQTSLRELFVILGDNAFEEFYVELHALPYQTGMQLLRALTRAIDKERVGDKFYHTRFADEKAQQVYVSFLSRIKVRIASDGPAGYYGYLLDKVEKSGDCHGITDVYKFVNQLFENCIDELRTEFVNEEV